MNRFLTLVVGAVAGLSGPGAYALPVTYQFSGTANGDVSGVTFGNAAFTIRVVTDTDGIFELSPGIFRVESFASSIDLAGFGLGQFITPHAVFVNQDVPALGFAAGLDLLDLFEPAFATYDLSSSFGPIFEASPVAVEQFTNQPTTLGAITFFSAHSVTFVATVVPEASTATLFVVGAAANMFMACHGFGMARRRPSPNIRDCTKLEKRTCMFG